MSENFSTVLVQDPRLMVSDNISYAVLKGGQNITEAQFNANSASASQINFNIPVPSEQTIIDRKVSISTIVNFNITVNNVANGAQILNLGVSDGLQSFSLQGSMSTITATINNTTVSLNAQDLKDFILLMNENQDIYKYHATTPCLPDSSYLIYINGNGIINNPLIPFSLNTLNSNYASRGSFPIIVNTITIVGGANNGVNVPVRITTLIIQAHKKIFY